MGQNRGKRLGKIVYRVMLAVPYLILLTLIAILGWKLNQYEVVPSPGAYTQEEFEAHIEDVTLLSEHEGRTVTVHATAAWPEKATAEPLVLLCHGFTGNRSGDGHFRPLAEWLAEHGIASIAADFAGNGDSEENFTMYTLTSMQQDLRAAVSYMQKTHDIDPKRLGMVGHSMGGRLVSMSLTEDVQAVALWSPANNTGLNGLEFLDKNDEGRNKLREEVKQKGSVDLPAWGVTIGEKFVEEMANSDPSAELSQYNGRVLVAFSAGDYELLSEQTIYKTIHAAQAADETFVNLYGLFENATHNYTAISGQPEEDREIRQLLEEKTGNFLCDALIG